MSAHVTSFQVFYRDEIAIYKKTGAPVKVIRHLRKNVEWQDQDGKPWRGDARLLEKAPTGTEFTLRVAADEMVTYDFGVVVRFKPHTKGCLKEGDQLFVVLKGQDHKHQLAWLNGHPTSRGMRYTGVHGSQLERVTV